MRGISVGTEVPTDILRSSDILCVPPGDEFLCLQAGGNEGFPPGDGNSKWCLVTFFKNCPTQESGRTEMEAMRKS